MRWIDPAFAQYPLGALYTDWIYSDPQANPVYYDQPDKWKNAGYIALQDVAINTTLGSVSGSSTQLDLILTGGKNCVVFARYAIVTEGTPLPNVDQKLPTQTWGYVLYSQRLTEGYWETQETALVNVFGTGWSPHTFPAPITWNDKLRRQITLTNNSNIGLDVNISLVWKIAYLNTAM